MSNYPEHDKLRNKKLYFVILGNDTIDNHRVAIVTDGETAKDDPNAIRHIAVYSLEAAKDFAYMICEKYNAEYVEYLVEG